MRQFLEFEVLRVLGYAFVCDAVLHVEGNLEEIATAAASCDAGDCFSFFF